MSTHFSRSLRPCVKFRHMDWGTKADEEWEEKYEWEKRNRRTEWREGFQKPQITEKMKRLLCEGVLV